MAEMICPSCGSACRPGIKFCEECGSRLDATCRINRELKRLKTQIAALEERKSKLMADFAR